MFLNEYQEKAKEFSIFPADVGRVGERSINIATLYLYNGLIAEVGEYFELYSTSTGLDTHLAAKELGDILWFVAVYAAEEGISLSELVGTNDFRDVERHVSKIWQDISSGVMLSRLVYEASLLANYLAKYIRDGKQNDVRAIPIVLTNLMFHLAWNANFVNIPLEDIAVINLRKLQSRKDRGKIVGSGSNR